MSDILKRMRATIGMDAINGDAFERSVVGKQFEEAANRIAELETENANFKGRLERLFKNLPPELQKYLKEMVEFDDNGKAL